MTLNNGIMERMKAASHRLVTMEIEGNPTVRDVEAYRRSRLPEVFEAHQLEWRRAYGVRKDITVEQLITIVTGRQVEAQQVSMGKAEANMAHVHEIWLEEPDPALNTAGLAAARMALREAHYSDAD